MKMYKNLLLFAVCFLSGILSVKAQVPARRIDTSMKVGKAGYKLICSNKSPGKNIVTVSPIGFDKDVREFSFEIKGRITQAEVDDINHDGFPDMVFYYFSNDSIPRGSVVGICSEKNESATGIMFPDIFDDPKLRIGYKGNDSFFLMEGYLVRRFPVYPGEGTTPAAANGNLIRQIQYQVVPGERGGLRFKPMRSYEFTKQ
jgi:hypothetical protein